MGIPIENIYYLLCYAWDKLEEKEQVAISIDDKTTLLDLLAKVLINGTKVLLKRGIDKNYINQTSEIAGIKGRLVLSDTLKSGLFQRQRTICSYDEYASDTLLNQLLVGTLFRLLKLQSLEAKLKQDVKQLLWMFPKVTRVELRGSSFKGIRYNRNNRFYGFLINVCQLIYESSLPAEQEGDWKFMDFTRDKRKMNQLYEAFIYNFYKREQSGYSVKREHIAWQLLSSEDSSHQFLPRMQTDITLESAMDKVIIDAKYYEETMAVRYESEKVKSVNLYQLFSYLLNQEKGDAKTENAIGMLLYPTIEKEYNLDYQYKGHRILIKTLNLNTQWKNIESRLHEILNQCNQGKKDSSNY